MDGISDIRIIGFDETRPPVLVKEPYINLYFKLSHKAPKQWCNDFNDLAANGKGRYPIKIDFNEGLIIETWVRQMSEIETALGGLKELVKNSTYNYIARIRAKAKSDMPQKGDVVSEEQARLNFIISELNFDETT